MMVGFAIGAASLAGLIYVLTHGHVGRRRWYGGPRRWLVGRLLDELDASPEQARTMVRTVDMRGRRPPKCVERPATR